MAGEAVHEAGTDELATAPNTSGDMIPEGAWKAILEASAVTEDPTAGGLDENGDPIETEPVKPAAEPAKPTEPVKPAEPPAAEEEVDPIEATLAGINETLDKIEKRIPQPEPAKPAEPPTAEVRAELKALLEHEDESVRNGAKALLERIEDQDKRLATLEGERASERLQAVAKEIEAEMADVAGNFGVVDDKGVWHPMTDEMVDAVAEYLESDPALASTLTFKEGALRKFPNLEKRTQAPKTDEPAKPKGPTIKVPSQPRGAGAHVIDGAAVAGATPKPERAPDGERMEQAVDRGFKAIFTGT